MNDFVRGLLRAVQHLPLRSRLARFYRSLEDPRAEQAGRLRDILAANAGTVYGREFGFAHIRNADEYRRAVPVRPYRAFAPYIDRMRNSESNVLVAQPLEMFAMSSGTEAEPKYIPVTRRFTVEHHYMHLMWLWQMMAARPLRIVGPVLTLISPAESERTPGGIPCGASSGKQYRDQSIPMRRLHPVPYEVFLIPDCLRKYYAMLLFALPHDIRSANSVNPSSLTLLADILNAHAEALLDDLYYGTLNAFPGFTPEEKTRLGLKLRPAPGRARALREIYRANGKLLPRDVWPNIAAINTWQGGCAPFYLPQVRAEWGDAAQRCWGLRATEGIFSVPHADSSPSGTVAVGAHFLEFADATENEELFGEFPETLLAHELTPGRRYRLICTTSGGLYRYDMGDIVECTGFTARTPDIAFLHKAGGVVSITGEKVSASHAVAAGGAVARAAAPLSGFTVGLETAGTPRYVVYAEPEAGAVGNPEDLPRMAEALDAELSRVNIEYRDKRASGRLGAPAAYWLPSGSYRKYRAYLVNHGRPDGQVKPPQLLKPEALADFLRIVNGD